MSGEGLNSFELIDNTLMITKGDGTGHLYCLTNPDAIAEEFEGLKKELPEHLTEWEANIHKTLINYIISKAKSPDSLTIPKLTAAIVLFETFQIKDEKLRHLALASIVNQLIELDHGESIYLHSKQNRLGNIFRDALASINYSKDEFFKRAVDTLYYDLAYHYKKYRGATVMSPSDGSQGNMILSRMPLVDDENLISLENEAGPFEPRQIPIGLTMSWIDPWELSGYYLSGDVRPMQYRDWLNRASHAPKLMLSTATTNCLDTLAYLLEKTGGGSIHMNNKAIHLHIIEKDCVEHYSPDQVAIKTLTLKINRDVLAQGRSTFSHCKSGVGRSFEVVLASRLIDQLQKRITNVPEPHKDSDKSMYDFLLRIAVDEYKKCHELRKGVVSGEDNKRIKNAAKIALRYYRAFDLEDGTENDLCQLYEHSKDHEALQAFKAEAKHHDTFLCHEKTEAHTKGVDLRSNGDHSRHASSESFRSRRSPSPAEDGRGGVEESKLEPPRPFQGAGGVGKEKPKPDPKPAP